MRPLPSAFLVAAFLLADTGMLQAASVATTSVSGSSMLLLEVDGTAAGVVTEWRGGDPIISYSRDLGSVASVGAAPLALKLPLPLSAPFQSMLRAFLIGEGSPHLLRTAEVLVDRPQQQLRAENTVVSELQLGATDAADATKSVPTLTLVLQPGSSRTDSSPSFPKDMGKARADRGAFSIRFSGGALPSAADARMIRGYSQVQIRAGSGTRPQPGPIILSVSPSAAGSFRAWRDEALGHAVASSGRQMTLDFLDGTLTHSRLSFIFKQVRPVRVARADDGKTVEVELAALSVELADASGSEDVSSTPPPDSPPPGRPDSSDTLVTPPDTGGSRIPVLDRTLKPASVPSAVPRTGLLATAADADQGLRDPKDFPRPAGLVRLRFTNSDYVTSSTEEAGYSSKRPLQELLDDYQTLLEKDGWTKTGSNDSGTSPETRMVLSGWQKGRTQADLRLYAAKEGSSVSLLVKYVP
jgi:hypothetical protein